MRELARQHGLLLVAAGQAGEGDVGAGGAHVEALHRVARGAAQRARGRAGRSGGSASSRLSNRFSARLMRGDAADRVPVFGHDADAGRGERLRRARRSSRGRARRSALRVAGVMPESTAASSLWPLPSTPAMPTISPRLTISVEVVEPASRPRRRGRSGRRPAAPRRRGLGVSGVGCAACRGRATRPTAARRASRSAPAPRPLEVALDHRAHQAIDLRAPAPSSCATTRPPRSTVTRCATCLISASLWVTSTTLQPLRRDALADREQALDLGRQQHRGRLVEHQQARLAHQALDDLDALALADRQVLRCARAGRARGRTRCDSASTRRGAVARAAARRVAWPSSRLSTTVRSGTRLKCWWTIAMPCGERLAPGRPAGAARRPAASRRRRARWTPKMRLHSVDLPAPFSPSRQWISPAAMSSETSSSACRLPKRLPCRAATAAAPHGGRRRRRRAGSPARPRRARPLSPPGP